VFTPATLISSTETSTPVVAPAATLTPEPSTLAFHLAAVSTSTWTPDNPVRYEDRLISRAELSGWIGISEPRLRLWQRLGIGPTARRSRERSPFPAASGAWDRTSDPHDTPILA
jgi:hypothetical protein